MATSNKALGEGIVSKKKTQAQLVEMQENEEVKKKRTFFFSSIEITISACHFQIREFESSVVRSIARARLSTRLDSANPRERLNVLTVTNSGQFN